jgi:hypothetical protein
MSTLTSAPISVPQLYTGAQITYFRRDWIVLEVLPMPIGGWVVVATAVDDTQAPPIRAALVYANPHATAELVHRSLEGVPQ